MRPEDEAWFKNDGSYKHKDVPDVGNTIQQREKTVEMFFDDCCELADGAFTSAGALNDALSRWKEGKARGNVGERRLLAVLVKLGRGRIERRKTGGVRGLRGVRLVSR